MRKEKENREKRNEFFLFIYSAKFSLFRVLNFLISFLLLLFFFQLFFLSKKKNDEFAFKKKSEQKDITKYFCLSVVAVEMLNFLAIFPFLSPFPPDSRSRYIMYRAHRGKVSGLSSTNSHLSRWMSINFLPNSPCKIASS